MAKNSLIQKLKIPILTSYITGLLVVISLWSDRLGSDLYGAMFGVFAWPLVILIELFEHPFEAQLTIVIALMVGIITFLVLRKK